MAVLTKTILGVVPPDVHPREYEAGTECPPELLEAAHALGALGEDRPARKAQRGAPENKAAG